MAVHQKLSEIGWFYHAPEPPRRSGPAEVPLASQIPGLNDLSSIPVDDIPRSMFRDTDTKYVRLAKKGGREDLLRFREPKSKNEQPVPYPRNEWFYLEDNRVADDYLEANKPWEFRLPEYMVHDEHRPFGDDYDYKNDPEGRVYWKKGRVAPGTKEIRHVSMSRNPNTQVLSAPAPMSAPRVPAAAPVDETANSRYPNVPQMYDMAGKPAMNKLLAYGYANEWQAARDDWYSQLRMMDDTEAAMAINTADERQQVKKGKNNMTWNEMMKARTQPANASRRTSASQPKEDKPMFKLSKYDKVGSKVMSHRVLPPIDGTSR